ncbi:hypothetical protein FJTKL_07419 [Diaporthe vaccinii]|uniref:Uncharacterized protein n=1 Tax=Diaporthe vaccinii TaxID=105482 RepID=A0ABR4EU26_9PEZI
MTPEREAEIISWNKTDGASSKASSPSKEDVHEPSPNSENDKDEARTSSESESSEEKDDADDSPPSPIIIRKKPVVRRPLEGYEDIELDACSDTSSIAGDEDNMGDENMDDDEEIMTDASSVYGYYGGDRTPDVEDPEYDEDRRWKLSEWKLSDEWKLSQELDDESDWETKPIKIPDRERAGLALDDHENTEAYMQMRTGQLLLEQPLPVEGSVEGSVEGQDVEMADC